MEDNDNSLAGVSVASFEESFSDSAEPQSLLLGNGFSIGFHSDFSYANLFEKADFQNLHIGQKSLVNSSAPEDFEVLSRKLRLAAYICNLYDLEHQRISEDAEQLESVLRNVLDKHHPQNLGSKDRGKRRTNS